MLSPKLEEKLLNAKLALDGATSVDIINFCKQYLTLLDEYRSELYKLPDTLDLNHRSKSSSSLAAVHATRKAVRTAIEHTTRERNQTETLLLSFTAVSGYEAAETLNKERYKGRETWELRAGGVGCADSSGEIISVQKAVETASVLRREAHISKTATLTGANIPDIFNCEPD